MGLGVTDTFQQSQRISNYGNLWILKNPLYFLLISLVPQGASLLRAGGTRLAILSRAPDKRPGTY